MNSQCAMDAGHVWCLRTLLNLWLDFDNFNFYGKLNFDTGCLPGELEYCLHKKQQVAPITLSFLSFFCKSAACVFNLSAMIIQEERVSGGGGVIKEENASLPGNQKSINQRV